MGKLDLIMIGNSGSGKTSLVNCFKHMDDNDNELKENGHFKHSHMPTLGINLEKKYFHYQDKKINLCIWDTAGQEIHFALTKQYFQKADGVIVVFDITDKDSFDKMESFWIQQVREYSRNEVKWILIGNKVDKQDEREVKYIDAMKFAQHNEMKFYECSAKTGEQVREAFETLAKLCLNSIENEICEQIILDPKNKPKKGCFDKFKNIFSILFGTDKNDDEKTQG